MPRPGHQRGPKNGPPRNKAGGGPDERVVRVRSLQGSSQAAPTGAYPARRDRPRLGCAPPAPDPSAGASSVAPGSYTPPRAPSRRETDRDAPVPPRRAPAGGVPASAARPDPAQHGRYPAPHGRVAQRAPAVASVPVPRGLDPALDPVAAVPPLRPAGPRRDGRGGHRVAARMRPAELGGPAGGDSRKTLARLSQDAGGRGDPPPAPPHGGGGARGVPGAGASAARGARAPLAHPEPPREAPRERHPRPQGQGGQQRHRPPGRDDGRPGQQQLLEGALPAPGRVRGAPRRGEEGELAAARLEEPPRPPAARRGGPPPRPPPSPRRRRPVPRRRRSS